MTIQSTVLVSSSWGTSCGIAEYAKMVIEHQPDRRPQAIGESFSPAFWMPGDESLDPAWVEQQHYDLLWLNYHRGLHSRLTPKVLRELKSQSGIPIVITYHDTYGESEPDQLTRELHDLADAFIVHEPCVGLPKAILIRQGVLPAAPPVSFYQVKHDGPWLNYFKAYTRQPVLGTFGFNFPWKNFDRLCEFTREAGWAIFIQSNNATVEDVERWREKNPDSFIVRGYAAADFIVEHLSGCDATAFTYTCMNSGTSAAIRLGLAARKPVIAFEGCRQFRDLYQLEQNRFGPRGMRVGISWVSGFDQMLAALIQQHPHRVHPGIVWHAHRDSWATQGAKYAEIFRKLLP